MSDADIPGHSLQRWVNQIIWKPTLGRNVAGPRRGFGCECGMVEYMTDDPYGEHEAHIHDVRTRLARRRWAEPFIGKKRAARRTTSAPTGPR